MSFLEKFFTDQYFKKSNLIWLLLPISIIHYFYFYIVKFLFKSGLLAKNKINIPTLVVGNIILGGSGKTQLVQYIVNLLKEKNFKVGIISRGYKGTYRHTMEVLKSSDPIVTGDEPVLLKQKLNVPVFIGKSRYQAAIKLLDKYRDINFIVSDDGLQHKDMYFDYKILIDDDRWVTNKMIMPVGPFREPYSEIKKFDGFRISNSRKAKRNFIKFSSTYAVNLFNKKRVKISSLKNIYLSVGIGNPEKLITSLKLIAKFEYKIYNDHYFFKESDFADEYNYLLTEKDAIKCKLFRKKNLWVIEPEISICSQFKKNFLKGIGYE